MSLVFVSQFGNPPGLKQVLPNPKTPRNQMVTGRFSCIKSSFSDFRCRLLPAAPHGAVHVHGGVELLHAGFDEVELRFQSVALGEEDFGVVGAG